MKRFILFLLVLLAGNGLLFSQQPTPADVLLKVKALEEDSARLKNELALYTKFYDEQKGLIDRYNIIFIIILILGSLGEFFVLKNNLSAEARKKIEEAFDRIIEEKKKFLAKVVRDEEYEEKIKARKKILILSNRERDFEDELREFFIKYRFRDPDYKRIADKVDYGQYDLIFFNNQNKNITTKELENIIKHAPPNIAFLCFRPDRQEPEPKARYINFSNNLNTLFPRMIELLHYRDTMEREL